MDTFAVESILIAAPVNDVFAFISDPDRLPDWTLAFREVKGDRAVMRTPRGEVVIGLAVKTLKSAGTIDWTMKFPDGTEARAYSRVVDLGDNRVVYSFILPAPAVPLERLEGALDEQRHALREELSTLRAHLEKRS